MTDTTLEEPPRCWRCGRALAAFAKHPWSIRCKRCKADNHSAPVEEAPEVDAGPRCWRCGRMLAAKLGRPWKIRCVRCKAENAKPLDTPNLESLE